MSQKQVIIFTDGGCDPNPGPGGWAALICLDDRELSLSGAEGYSTNNRMELTAAIQALRQVPAGSRVLLHTDSRYLQQGITEWLPEWQARGWRRQGGKLANVDLWQELAQIIRQVRVEWRWVKAHSGNPLNERVDKLVREARRKAASN